MSRASTSAVRRANAFFDPSGLCKGQYIFPHSVLWHDNEPDKGVDLDSIDIVELLQGLLDLSLVGLDIYNEDEGVVLLNLLHGTLGIERVDNDLVLIKTWLVWNRATWVLWSAGELKSLWLMEGGRQANLANLVGVGL